MGLFLALIPLLLSVPTQGGAQDLILGTTTSVRDAGLLDEIVPMFERESGIRVLVVAVGTGQALVMGQRGEADALIVHAPAAELELVEAGLVQRREPLMHNWFVLLGPPSDPAGVRGAGAVEALRRIAEREAGFISRGDQSGTHQKELSIWAMAGGVPTGEWYLESGQGMGATLQIAYERRLYTLSDIGTYLTHQTARHMDVMVEASPALINPYHIMVLDSAAFARGTREGNATRLAEFLLRPSTQDAITAFRRADFGRSIFVAGPPPGDFPNVP